MAKYEFEWDDEQAKAVQEVLMAKAESATQGRLFFNNVAQRIDEQTPQIPPTKKMALVETTGGQQYALLHLEDAVQWFGPINHSVDLGHWCRPSEVPTPFTVLFEGVDL